MRGNGPQGGLPLPVVMAFCVGCFLFGHFTHRGTPALSTQPSAAAQRKLSMDGAGAPHAIQEAAGGSGGARPVPAANSSSSSSSSSGGSSSSGPHFTELPDLGRFTESYLQQSGLAALRPPLKPAASGDDFTTIIPYQVLSWHPRMLVLPGFLDKARCEHVIRMAKAKMQPSGLAWRPGEAQDAQQQTRTSTGTFLAADEDKDGVLSWVEEKIARFTMLPVSHGEHFNVLRYENEQHYDSHMDSFDPKEFGPQATQRLATMLLILSDVESGGETVFKKEGKDGAGRIITEWRTCEPHEYKYQPRMGDALLFYTLDPDLTINARALHGGCPVHKGEKWVMTKWLHEKPVRSELQ